MIKVIIADDHSMLREGFKTLLRKIRRVEVIAEAANGQNLLDLVKEAKPDIAIVDVQMPVMNGIIATTQLHQQYPEIGVIALSMFIDNETVIDMLRAGARGYLTKNTSKEELTKAITAVHKGGNYYSDSTQPDVASLIDSSQLNPFRNTKPANLTIKEIEIVQFICKEYSTKQIAPMVHLTQRTVETYRVSIQEKIGATNVVGVVLYAIKHGLFEMKNHSVSQRSTS